MERLTVAGPALAAALLLAVPVGGPPLAPVVAGVVLKLPPGEDAATLEGLVAARAGQPLSQRALRRTATLLFQLGRFSDVTIRAVPAGEGQVLLVVECLPRRVVRSLRIANPARRPVIEETQLRRLLDLGVGDEFWQGRLDQGLERVKEAYLRRGHRRVRLAARAAGETRVDLAVEVEEGQPTRVAAIGLGALSGDRAARFLEGMRTRPGEVLDLDVLDADVKAMRQRLRREGWLRSRVADPVVQVEPAGARVSVAVEPGPRVAFRFAGNAALGESELQAALGIDPEQPFDEPSREAAAGRIRALYQERGWAAVRVEAREIAAGERLLVLFEVDEGRRYRVVGIRFPAVRARAEDWLRARFLEGLEAAASEPESGEGERLALASGLANRTSAVAAPEPGQAFHEPAWKQAMARVVDLYRADGHLDAAHEGTRVTLDARAGTAEVELRLREGPRTRIESVAFEGNVAVPLARILEEARVRPGDPLSLAAVEQTRAALLALYSRQGYLYARVQDLEDFSPDRTAAALRFHIEEGPQVRIGSVLLAGNRRTRDDVVRSAVEVHPGDVYDPGAVAKSQSALLRLGVFRSVGLRLNDPEVPESEKDLTVELAERPWRTVAPGLGVSSGSGVRATVEYSQPNLYGMALELAGRAKVNDPGLLSLREDVHGKPLDRMEGYANVGLHYPRFHLFPFPVGGHLDLIGERVHRRAYDMSRTSTALGTDLALISRLAFSLQGELELADINRRQEGCSAAGGACTLTRADVERLRFPEGITTLVSIRPALSLDYRDNAVHPRSGWFATLGADLSHSIGYRGGERTWFLFGVLPGSEVYTNMLKLQGTLTGYLPVGSAVVLALSLRGGRVLLLDSRSQVIGPKRFFMGGASTMRGYAEDEMVPEDIRADLLSQVRDCAGSLSGQACTPAAASLLAGNLPTSEGGLVFALAKAEARFRLRGSLEAGLFADVGNLWLDPRNVNLGEIRVHVGVGLRFVTPIGPAVLDLGLNTSADRNLNEHLLAPHFSIGLF